MQGDVMMRSRVWLAVGVVISVLGYGVDAVLASGLDLARELTAARDYPQAAIEFRRLAIETEAPREKGAYYWMAGYAYWKADRWAQAERMLGEAEDAAPDLETEIYLLRAENSRASEKRPEAEFYFESLSSDIRPEPVRRLATKRLAVMRTEMADFEGAREALQSYQLGDADEGVTAINAYENGKSKSMMVGGLLGLIPGLGYAYAGEYANAARSLILNSLCIWGLVEFAGDEQWGGVALVGFAEVTFYSGSVYGGVDAVARYNDMRLQRCTSAIERNAHFEPLPSALPLLELTFEF